MADLKISELPAADTPLNNTEEVALTQSGVTKRASIDNISADIYSTVIELEYTTLGLVETDTAAVKKAAISTYLEGYVKVSNHNIMVTLYDSDRRESFAIINTQKGTISSLAISNIIQLSDRSRDNEVLASANAYADALVAGLTVEVPTGSIYWFGVNSAPTGYLVCDGSAIDRTTYSDLFTLFDGAGLPYGSGDGSTTFNLPDLRGEFIRGLDDGRGVDSGRVLGTSQGDAFASHSHGLSQLRATTNVQFLAGFYDRSVGGSSPGYTTDSTGGTETRPRNIALVGIIKT